MKTQNTLENKAKFFAQYWGQEVLIANPHVNQKNPFKCEQPYIYHNTDIAWLELTPLSQISDEDLEKCLKILGQRLDLESFRESFIEGLSNRDFYAQFYPVRAIEIADYLRSKGYALTYMDLSVEDLVEYGWVKLKEN